MRFIAPLIFWLACFLSITQLTESARILAIIPVPSYSHQIPFQPLWATLSQRGHQVVVLTTDPIGDSSLTNLTEIDFRSNYKLMRQLDFAKLRFTTGWLTITRDFLMDIFEEILDNILGHPEVRKMYAPNSGEHFDVILVELDSSPGLYTLAHRFNAPLIGVKSFPILAATQYKLGLPILPSHPSTCETEKYSIDINVSLWQKTKNFIQLWYHIYYWFNHYVPRQQAIAEKYFGKDIPNINEIEKNISIIFTTQAEVTSFIRPQSMNVINIGGLNIIKKPTALPNDLKKFLDDAPNGFIYVSLGTNVVTTSLPTNMQRIFYDVFASLPCKVVWKMDEDLANKPDNIYIAKWLPQQSILAHPNIRLFVYQGGLRSTEEAIHYAVPLLGIPVLGDQYTNVNKMISVGAAKHLDITKLSAKDFNSSIMDILTDKRYKETMLDIKTLNEDKPYDMLENAIWWIEFVIRHKGAPHLHTTIVHQAWYERYDMDVIAILSITLFILLICAVMITYKLLQIIIMYFWMKVPMDIEKKAN